MSKTIVGQIVAASKRRPILLVRGWQQPKSISWAGRRVSNIYSLRKYVTAKFFKGFAGAGVSESALIECDNGKTYIVKFNDVRPDYLYPKTLPNEYLAYRLAKSLVLPVPDCELIWVPRSFIEKNPQLRQRRKSTSPVRSAGIHFGCLEIKNSYTLDHVMIQGLMRSLRLFSKIRNRQEMVGTIVFDTWTLNGDRVANKGNTLLRRVGEAKFDYYQIDHGHCFTGADWTHSQLGLVSGAGNVLPGYQGLHSQAIRRGCFEEYLTRMESVDDIQISSAISIVPSAWKLNDLDKSTLKTFLLARAPLVRSLLYGAFERSVPQSDVT